MLLLRATRDRIVSGRLSQELANALPHAQGEIIDGPHLLLQALPHECAAAIGRFARALDEAPSGHPVNEKL
jgi:hypothetical protein